MDPISAYLIQFLVGLAISAAVNLATQAFSSKQEATKQAVRGFRGQYSYGGTTPLRIVLGTYGVAGHLEYRNTWGNSDETPNAFLVDVLSLSDYQITDVTAAWVDTQDVTLPGTDLVTQGYPVPEYADGGKDHLWYRFRLGDQTTVSSYLSGKFGADAVRPWEDEMVGAGIAQAIMTARVNDKLWTGFPTYMFQVQGAPVFDPRLSTAAGGSGSEVWGTFSTYAFSDNPIVLIYNILRGIHDAAGTHIWGGRATAYQLPYATWAAAMDACDVLVNKKGGGTEKRYRAGIEISVNERPTDVIRELLIGCNGRIAQHQGQYFILIDVPASADGSFTDADVLSNEAVTLSLFPNLDEVVNGATATFMAPQRAWESKETAPYYRSDLEAEDGGRRLLQSLTLRTVFSGSQAQRILKAVVEESRRLKKHVVVLTPGFGVYRPLQVLAWPSAEFSYTAKLWLITSKTEDEWGRIYLALQEIDPADFDWDETTDETELSYGALTPITPSAQVMTGWTAVPAFLEDPDGNGWLPSIEVGWATNQDDVARVRIQVRETWDSSRLIFDGSVEYDIADASPSKTINASFLPASDYEARGIYVSTRPDRTMRWSNQDEDGTEGPWLGVTTPNVSPLPPGSIFIETLGDDLKNAVGLITNPTNGSILDQLTALRQRADELAAAVMDVSATAKERLDLLSVSREGAAAAIIRSEVAIVTESEARATAIEEVVASFGDSFADGFLKFDALVNESEATATITAKVKAEADGVLSQAAWIIKASVDGDSPESVFGVYADRFALVNDINDLTVSPFYTDAFGNVYINNAFIALASITSAYIGPQAIIAGKLGPNAVQNSNLPDGVLTRRNFSLKVVGGAQIDDLAVGTAQIGTGAVSTDKIPDGALTRSKFALKVVGGAQIDDLAVGFAQIGNGAITSAKVATQGLNDRNSFALKVIGGAQIDDLAVGNSHIQNLSVDRIKIANGAVTELVQDSVTGGTTPVDTAYQTICSISVSGGNYPIPIGAYLDFTTKSGSGSIGRIYDVRVTVTIDGVARELSQHFTDTIDGGVRTKLPLICGSVPALPSGSYTVRLQQKCDSDYSTGNHTVSSAKLSAGQPQK